MEEQNIMVGNIKLQLEEDGSFAVKEFMALDIFAAVVFYLIFLLALYNMLASAPEKRDAFYIILLFTLCVAGGFTFKACSKNKYMQINKEGIWINNRFITNWENFVSARYQELKFTTTKSFTYKYVLFLYYYKSDGVCYLYKAPIVSTQNKAA